MCPLCKSKLTKIEWPAFVVGYDLLCECGYSEVKYYGQSNPASHPKSVSTITPIFTIICPDTSASTYACADGFTDTLSDLAAATA